MSAVPPIEMPDAMPPLRADPPRGWSTGARFGCGCGIVAAVSILAVVVVLVLSADDIGRSIDDAYAQQSAAQMVIDWMREHDGEWPPSWETMRRHQLENPRTVFPDEALHRYKDRIYIDFDADVDELRRLAKSSDHVPFEVIHAKSHFAARMGDGPNAQIYRYLRYDDDPPLRVDPNGPRGEVAE